MGTSARSGLDMRGCPPFRPDAGEIADIEAKVLAAQAAQQAQLDAQQKARSATLAFHNAVDALTRAGGSAVLKVRAKAQTTDDEQVYTRAWLPRPKRARRRSASRAGRRSSRFTWTRSGKST